MSGEIRKALAEPRHPVGTEDAAVCFAQDRAALAELDRLERIIAWYWRAHGPYPPQIDEPMAPGQQR